ncbi:MAG TPA: hypothetical protein VEQ42_04750 [Pyrinomonadaceae bacterium]|nr:hypothetical protein [Pyrinomonadaceae bacterium]
MRFEIRPHEGVGPVRFGMTREEVRAALALPVESFRKSPADEMLTDAFDAAGLHVYYKKPGLCEAVEMAAPAEPVLEGRELLGRPFGESRRWFESQDESAEADESGLTSFGYGVGLYAPEAESNPAAPPEGVIVFEKGYYG